MPEMSKSQTWSEPEGSPQSGEPLYLAVGRLLRTHGLKGDLLMEILTDFPERIKTGQVLYVGSEHQPLSIRGIRGHSSGLIISFPGIDTPEQAAELRNQLAFVRADEIPPLPDGEFYQHQLLGLRVVSEDGQQLGKIEGIIETGANDVFIVRQLNNAELLLPNISDVVLDVNLAQGEIQVHLLPGLMPD